MIYLLVNSLNTYAQKSYDYKKPTNDNDSINELRINNILIIGNNRTKEKIIIRELVFEKGMAYTDYMLNNKMEISRLNLLKLPLFNYVTIQKFFLSDNSVDIHIIVEERWFIWPEIAIINNERNFNAWWETKDFSKLDYRFSIRQYNIFGLNHVFRVGLSFGFTREFSLVYDNIILDKNQHHFLGVYTSVFYQKDAFYLTYQNKLQTFTSNDENALEGKELEVFYTYRPGFNNKHRFSIAYREQHADDSLVWLNNNYFGKSQTALSYLELAYRFTHDKRNSRGYPTKGSLFNAAVTQKGFNLIEPSGLNLFSINGNYKKYYQISGKFYGANSVSVKKTFNEYEVYYLKKGLGYRNNIRGYEYYVIDGQDYMLLKNNLKYNLLPLTIINFNFIPIKKFRKIHFAVFLNAYFDIGYVNDKFLDVSYMNDFSNNLQYSGGIGIDLASYYDSVFRLEYSIIKNGESGVFIHFTAPI